MSDNFRGLSNDFDNMNLSFLCINTIKKKILDNEWNRFADVGKIMSNGYKDILKYSPNMTVQDFAYNVKGVNYKIYQDDPKLNYIFKKIDDWANCREPNVASLYECMLIDDEKKPVLLDILRKLIKGKKGKDVALVFLVCEYYHLMTRPPHKVLTSIFGDIGTKQSYNNPYKMSCDRDIKSGMITKIHMNPDGINAIKSQLSPILIVDN